MNKTAKLKSDFDHLLRQIRKNLEKEQGLPSSEVKEAIDKILKFNLSGMRGELNWPEMKTLLKNMADLSSLVGVYRLANNKIQPARFDKQSLETRYKVAAKFLAGDLEKLNWNYLELPARQNPEYLKFLDMRARMTDQLSPPAIAAEPSNSSPPAIETGFMVVCRKTLFFIIWMALWFSGLYLFSWAGSESFFRTSGLVKVIVVIAAIVFIFGWLWFSGEVVNRIWHWQRNRRQSFFGWCRKALIRLFHTVENFCIHMHETFKVIPIPGDPSRVILEPLDLPVTKSGLPRDSHGFRIGQKLEITKYQIEEGGEETGLIFYRVFKSQDVQVDCGVNAEGYIFHIRVSYDHMPESDQDKFLSDFNRRFRKFRLESRSGFVRTHIYADRLTEVSLLMVPASNLMILNVINIVEIGAVPRFSSGHTLGDFFIPEKREYRFSEKKSLRYYRYSEGQAVITLAVNRRNRTEFISWMVEGMDSAAAARLARVIHNLCFNFLKKKKGQKKPELTLGHFFIHEFRDRKTSLTVLYDRGKFLMSYENLT